MNNEEKECPFCSETIKFTAVKCKHCGSMLDDSSEITNTWQDESPSPEIPQTEPSFSGASYLILVLVAVALFLTNPTKQEFAEYAWDKIINTQGDNELIKESGALGKGMIKAGINLFTTHNDYFIFSTFHVNTSAIDFITGDSTSVKIIGIAGYFIPYGSHGFGSSSTPATKSSENIQVEKNEQTQNQVSNINQTKNNLGANINEIIAQNKSRIDKQFDNEGWSLSILFDINNDGVSDFIVAGTTSYSCGSGGCTHVAYISRDGDYKEYNLGTLHNIVFNNQNNKLIVTAHGSACNLPGSEDCEFEISWNGDGFTRTAPKVEDAATQNEILVYRWDNGGGYHTDIIAKKYNSNQIYARFEGKIEYEDFQLTCTDQGVQVNAKSTSQSTYDFVSKFPELKTAFISKFCQ